MSLGGRSRRGGGRSPKRPSPSTDIQRDVELKLSPAQVNHVLREATDQSRLGGVLTDRIDALRLAAIKALGEPENATGEKLSRSTLHALIVLGGFAPPGTEKRISEVASELGSSLSTTHRYAATLAKVGLLEQNAETRRYRIPLLAGDDSASRSDAGD